jgi:hypothetical protein
MSDRITLNDYQKAVLRVYAEGDNAHLMDFEGTKEEFDRELNDAGDTLFRFLMVELSDNEDCTDLDTAIQRVSTAIDDIEAVKDALEDMEA